MKENFSIQFISHTTESLTYLEGIKLALKGGCKWIQLRMKDASDEEFMSVAIQARRLCSEAGATFILDDRVEMVEKCGADGVHLGKNDMSPDKAREILGRGKIIGGTANTLEDIISLYEKGVALALDSKMVPRSEWGNTPLHEGAKLLVIRATCGG